VARDIKDAGLRITQHEKIAVANLDVNARNSTCVGAWAGDVAAGLALQGQILPPVWSAWW